MSALHLEDIRRVLAESGWSVAEVLPGNEYNISGIWRIQQAGSSAFLLIDFEGLDDMVTLPIEQSYACVVRGSPDTSLYFRRINRSAVLWTQELEKFVAKLGRSAQPTVQPDGPASGGSAG